MIDVSHTAERLSLYLQATEPENGGIIPITGALQESLNRVMTHLDTFTADFSEHEYALIRGFLSPWFAKAIWRASLNLNIPSQTVNIKTGGRWSMYKLDDTLAPFTVDGGQDPFSVLLLSSYVVDVICRIVGVSISQLLTTKQWLNRYGEGEYIVPHKDVTGDFEVIFCLTAPPSENGGQLVIQDIAEISLAAGDLLIFRPSYVQHWTVPIKKTPSLPEPIRVTGVCRFYIQGGKEPDSFTAVYAEDDSVLGYKSKDGSYKAKDE